MCRSALILQEHHHREEVGDGAMTITVPLKRSRSVTPVVETWRDYEFWGPEGLGCAHCHEHPPVVFGLRFGALCWECLERCFMGWDAERLIQWLGRQKATLNRQQERRAAIRAWESRADLVPSLEYEEKYGVWLFDYPHP